jgi:glycosyltransferase involved in cell wall biosynthesis
MESKPRIYIAIPTFHPLVGGAETQTLAQSQRLIEKGYQIQIITFRHHHTWLSRETIQGVPVMRVAGLFLGRRDTLPRLLQQLMYLIAIIVMSWTLWHHRKKYEILQVCQLGSLCLPLAVVCRLARKPMTILLINSGSGDPRTKSKGPATLLAGPLDPKTPWLRVDGPTWIDGDIYGVLSMNKFIRSIMYRLLKDVHAVLLVLSTQMLRCLKEHNLDLPGTRVIPNGVDIVRFQPPSSNPTNEEWAKTVVCVSKLRYEKGTDVLLQAWHLVQKQMPDARLIIVGSGPLQGQQEMLADALHIRQSVEFAGLQSDVPAQLHRGMIAVLPSRWEGMPNALLEAMATGCACVATRVSGSEDLIQNGVNGLLVTPEDYSGLAEALLTLLKDPTLAKKYGAAARASIEQHYTLEHILDMYIDLYRELANRHMHTAESYSKLTNV